MADDILGKSLGRYQVLERLGQGGMAVVYKAFDTSLERYVAIKLILPYHEYSGQLLARFHREARTLAKLTHPNIVKIFDYGEFENHPFLVMEYVPGGTLKDWLIGKPMPWQKSAQLLARVARALEAAHAEGVIHRDVKPANILMANGKDPLLSDFGIAKLVDGHQEATSLTGTGVGIGTPDYMAPEQGNGIVDERSDVYALGVIFYQMVTGRLPYEADTPLEIMFRKTTEPLPHATEYVSDLPDVVDNILLKSLAANPQHRYKNMGEFADALEGVNSGANTLETLSIEGGTGSATYISGVGHSPPPEPATGKGAPRWSSRAIPVSVGFILVAATLIIFTFWRTFGLGAAPNNKLPSVTTTPERRVEMTSIMVEADRPLENTPTLRPRVTPTVTGGGKWIAFNSRMDGDANIYLVDTNGNNLTRLTSSSAHDFYASWSPDGTRIVYQTNEGEDQEIAIIDISTKQVTSVTKNTCNDWAPVWSPAGDWITFYSDCDGDRNIYKIHPDGSGRTQLTFTSGSNSWFPAWSPDGKKITFTSNRSGKYRIYIMNADGSNVKELAAGCVSYFSPDGKQILYGVYCDDTDDLFLMNADGSHQIALTNGCECKNATWSPDGTQIVFQLSKTTKDGPFALYRMYLNKPDRADWILLTDYDVNGGSPVWQP